MGLAKVISYQEQENSGKVTRQKSFSSRKRLLGVCDVGLAKVMSNQEQERSGKVMRQKSFSQRKR